MGFANVFLVFSITAGYDNSLAECLDFELRYQELKWVKQEIINRFLHAHWLAVHVCKVHEVALTGTSCGTNRSLQLSRIKPIAK